MNIKMLAFKFYIITLCMVILSSCGAPGGEINIPEGANLTGGTIVTPPVVPTPTITVLSNPASMSGGSVATITATVKDASGADVADGTLVTFSVGDSSFGSVSPTSATTSGGNVSVNFAALNKSGSVVIKASATVGGVPVSGSVNVNITAAANAVTVVATPSSVPVGGTSAIQVTVTDSTGASVPDNTAVVFSLSDSTKGSVSPGTSYITGGVATATFTANAGATGTVDVIATSLGKTGKATITIADGTIALSAPTSLLINGTNAITATVTGGTGSAMGGKSVTFTVSAGATLALTPGGTGSSSANVTTDTLGVATVYLKAGGTPVDVTVNATSTNILPDDALITISPGTITLSPPATVYLSSAPPTTTITATLADGSATGVVDGTVVTFTVTGDATLDNYAPTTSAGQVTVTLTPGGTSGPVVVRATSPNMTTTEVTITIAPTTLDLLATTPISSSGSSTIEATLTDTQGFIDGATVTFEETSSDATLSITTPVATTGGGKATVNLTAGLVTTITTVTVTATASTGASSTVTITINP